MNDGFDEALTSTVPDLNAVAGIIAMRFPAQLAELERGTRMRAMLKGPHVPVAASPDSVGATSTSEVDR
jgi:hypothetical protein